MVATVGHRNGYSAVAASTQLNKIFKTLTPIAEGNKFVVPSPATNTPPPSGTPKTPFTKTAIPTETDAPVRSASDTPTPTNEASVTPIRSHTPTPGTTSTPGAGIFIDGPGGNVNTAKDTLMSSHWPTRNGGAHANFQLDGAPGAIQHVLLQFDLSSLSQEYVCTSAKLYLYHSYDPEGGGLNTGKVYRITAANWPWITGVGNIDIARDGEPCWIAREADGNEGIKTPWAGSEGCSTRGVDYEPDPLGEWSFRSDSPIGTEIVIELAPHKVQEWFGTPNANYGIILVTDDRTYHAHVGSAENPNANYRPKLIVTYE